MDPYHEFLDFVVKALVDHPEDVVIVKSVDNLGVLLTLTVHPDDMGKVIGRQGKIATQAIRPLLTAVGLKHNARVSLKINEPVGGKRGNNVSYGKNAIKPFCGSADSPNFPASRPIENPYGVFGGCGGAVGSVCVLFVPSKIVFWFRRKAASALV